MTAFISDMTICETDDCNAIVDVYECQGYLCPACKNKQKSKS
jgi:hypothetical protein